ncbi:hypothetical protein GEMRC1_011171 [Eukaryota sp. GEM-RC1]
MPWENSKNTTTLLRVFPSPSLNEGSCSSSLPNHKKGSVRNVITERYLRDDIFCGLESCPICDFQNNPLLSADYPIIIPDIAAAASQVAFLESEYANNVIFLDTVLKSLPTTVYKRLRKVIIPGPDSSFRRLHVFANEHHRSSAIALSSSPSEHIISAVQWLSSHLSVPVILLSDNLELQTQSTELGLNASTTYDYVSTTLPDALDIVLPPQEVTRLQSTFFSGYTPHIPVDAALAAVARGSALSGSFRASRFNPFKGTVSGKKIDVPIEIDGRDHVNRAMDGDSVVVELLPENDWKDGETPSGRVVSILSRAWRDFCGSIDPPVEGIISNICYFIPVNSSLPKFKVRLPRKFDDYIGKRLVTRVDDWSVNELFPTAHVVRIIGDLGVRVVEGEVILIEHQVPYNEFGSAVLACLPPSNYSLPSENRSKDLTSQDFPFALSIPPGCRDIDDALHARWIIEDDGKSYVEVGVHIADVTHFVKPHTSIDEEAFRRSTTCYLVDKRVDMLPRLLTEDLCSLRCNVERCAFSVVWKLDPSQNFKILETKFGKSVIKSQASFTYADAQRRKDDPSLTDELTESVRLLHRVALALREKRMEKGALVLASTAVQFSLDETTREPFDVQEYESLEVNYLVEEFMLLANHSVAHQIFSHYPSHALLRRHPSPPPHAFDKLIAAIEPLGISLSCESNKALAESLNRVPKKYEKYLKQQVTQCMALAKYFSSGQFEPSEFFHYGLSLDLYTHFTSPIRRYADVIVHRLLAASIGYEPLDSTLAHKDRVSTLSETLNFRHKNAQDAGRQSMVVTSLLLLKDPIQQRGIVTKILEKGVVVFVPKFGVDSLVKLSDRGDFSFENGSQVSVGGRRIKLFDKLDVLVSVDEHAKTHTLKAAVQILFLEHSRTSFKLDLTEE